MGDNKGNSAIGLILGGIFAVAALVFIMTGGQFGGVKEVKTDADLPPIATGAK
jgi:hypothetical protein